VKLFERIIEKLEVQIGELNRVRIENGDFRLPKAKIVLLGQFSLLANPRISAQLHIPATMDVDARIEANHQIKEAFLKILDSEGLHYDEDSGLVWIPPKSTFETIYESTTVEVTAISPIYGILSKAIKAKEKNRLLVQEAIGIFGESLVKLIVKYGGDPEYFIKD
jgi:hypothetical protein